jgi:hypothetical protein
MPDTPRASGRRQLGSGKSGLRKSFQRCSGFGLKVTYPLTIQAFAWVPAWDGRFSGRILT